MRPFPLGSRPVPLAHLRRHPLIAAAAMIITAAAVSLMTGCAAADQVAGSTFSGVAGTATITTATDQLVGGSYSVVAMARDTGGQISVTGTFTAPVQAATD